MKYSPSFLLADFQGLSGLIAVDSDHLLQAVETGF